VIILVVGRRDRGEHGVEVRGRLAMRPPEQTVSDVWLF
jgi:hypothetical protein